jgi:hypothetical protein
LFRIPIDPGDSPAHLIGHWEEAAADLLHGIEVEDDVVRAGVDEHLGRIGVFLRRAAPPGAAVDVDVDGRVRLLRRVDVEALDRRRPVGEALRRAEALDGGFAVPGAPPPELLLVGSVFALVVGGVELHLIHIEPDARAFFAHCRAVHLLLRRGRPGACHQRPRARRRKNSPSRHLALMRVVL